MLMLGLDTTAVSASAAIAEADDGGLKTYAVFSVKNKMTHSENLLPMIDDALRVYGAEIGDVGLIAVNVGPGSFTGVRIGVSTAKGLAFPKGIPCAPVSTLEAIAENVRGLPGTVCALMDARRSQFYYALFRDGERLTEDAAGSVPDILDRLPPDGDVWLCGDGASAFAKNTETVLEKRLRLTPETSRDQNALATLLCGYRLFRSGGAVTGGDLRPVYLRMPQAERERMEKGKEKEKEKGNA